MDGEEIGFESRAMNALLRGQHVVFLLGVHAGFFSLKHDLDWLLVILDALECRSTSNLMCPIRIRREASRITTVSAGKEGLLLCIVNAMRETVPRNNRRFF